MQLQNQTILITGGTSGIGKALVEQLAAKNRLLVIGRDPKKLEDLKQHYTNINIYACQLDKPEKLYSCLQQISNDHQPVSVIINNAAMQYNKKFTDADFNPDYIQQEVTLNLITPIKICAYFLPILLTTNSAATIVNLSSGLALFPKTSSAVYSATKAGLHNFSQSLGYQLENSQIKVIDVILPMVDTPMTHGRGSKKLSAVEAATQIIRGIEREITPLYVGKSRWIPLLARLSPQLMARIMKTNS